MLVTETNQESIRPQLTTGSPAYWIDWGDNQASLAISRLKRLTQILPVNSTVQESSNKKTAPDAASRTSARYHAIAQKLKSCSEVKRPHACRDVCDVRKIGDNPVAAAILYGIGSLLILMLAHETFQSLAFVNHFAAGLTALKDGKYDTAQIEFSTSISARPANPRAYLCRAVAEVGSGNCQAALSDFNRAIAILPANPKLYLARASLNNRLGNYISAINDCNCALKLGCPMVNACIIRAIAYNHTGRYNQAIADCSFLLAHSRAHNKQQAAAFANRAYALYRKSDYRSAAADYTKALAENSGAGEFLASRASVFEDLHEWKKAINDCNAALKLLPAQADIFGIRSVCYARLGKPQLALKDLDRLVQLNPTVENHRLRGSARLRLHDYQGASEDFDYVLGALPHDRDALKNYREARLNVSGGRQKPTARERPL